MSKLKYKVYRRTIEDKWSVLDFEIEDDLPHEEVLQEVINILEDSITDSSLGALILSVKDNKFIPILFAFKRKTKLIIELFPVFTGYLAINPLVLDEIMREHISRSLDKIHNAGFARENNSQDVT